MASLKRALKTRLSKRVFLCNTLPETLKFVNTSPQTPALALRLHHRDRVLAVVPGQPPALRPVGQIGEKQQPGAFFVGKRGDGHVGHRLVQEQRLPLIQRGGKSLNKNI